MTDTTTPPDNAGLADRLEELADYLAFESYYGSARTVRKAAEALRPSVWRDISTAPKGVDVLVCSEDFEGPVVAVKVSGRDADWWTYDIHELGPTPCEVTNPTHWMPLPTPPKAPTP